MPIDIIKGSWKYCTKNKWFFLFVLFLLFLLETFADSFIKAYYVSAFIFFILMGYGLQVTHDVINGGVRLPKLMPKKMINYMIKGGIVFAFYVAIQSVLLYFIASYLKFPVFVIEKLFVEYYMTINLIFTHDIVSFIIFMVSGFIIVYVTSFFMELALARLADGGNLKNAFNFPRIKHAIDVIGWKNYTVGYSKIIISVIILLHINHLLQPYYIINVVSGVIIDIMIFAIEYRGIGMVYKVYVDSKKNS